MNATKCSLPPGFHSTNGTDLIFHPNALEEFETLMDNASKIFIL